MPFSSLGLSPSLVNALRLANYKEPYPIQSQAIPAILAKKDVLGIAQTGSGKTAAYALPILEQLQHKTKSKNRFVNVLVLVPTRELADQVSEVFKQFSKGLSEPVKTMAVYGGVSINPQMMALQGVNVLVATPGRLIELEENNAVHLSEISVLVLDEADKMLNLGFKEEMTRIFDLLPKKRQNLLFSATLSEKLDGLNQVLLKDPLVVKIEAEEANIDLIKQTGYFVTEVKKGPLLRYLIKHNDLKQVLVFTSSIYSADKVVDKLKKNGIDAMAIHGDKSQEARKDALHKFKIGKTNVLVATDLISRGIDIKFLPCVINYELPRSPKDYIHRIGRTGRAESPGEAITLVTEQDKHHFRVIQKKMGKWVTMIDSEGIDLKGF
jgi:ATP-dependent RNA helicase RhlE